MARPVRTPWWTLTAVALALAVVGCADPEPYGSPAARAKGKELVEATRRAGVAPRLTVEVAVSLYGVDAPSVCEAFRGGTSTTEELILKGNLAQGRRKVITDDAVTYSRLVVQTYCPEVLPEFDQSVQDLDPVGT